MARIVIIGGHGKVARLLAPSLVARGDEVTSLIRNPDHTEAVAATGARPLVADVEQLDAAALTDLVVGNDAVVWSAGAGGGDPARTHAVDQVAAITSMQAAADAGVGRYVMVSYLGSRPDHGVDPSSSFFPYAEAKAAADEHLRGTGLDWTILCPGALTEEPPTGAIEISDAPGAPSVTRADVAAVIAEVLRRPDTIGATIPFNNGDTPIDEALARRI